MCATLILGSSILLFPFFLLFFFSFFFFSFSIPPKSPPPVLFSPFPFFFLPLSQSCSYFTFFLLSTYLLFCGSMRGGLASKSLGGAVAATSGRG